MNCVVTMPRASKDVPLDVPDFAQALKRWATLPKIKVVASQPHRRLVRVTCAALSGLCAKGVVRHRVLANGQLWSLEPATEAYRSMSPTKQRRARRSPGGKAFGSRTADIRRRA